RLYSSLYLYRVPRDIHSFPTRRSSDLELGERAAVPHRGRHLDHIATGAERRSGCIQQNRPHVIARSRLRRRIPPSQREVRVEGVDRKSTRLNSSHVKISYAVFCLKKKK